MCPFIRKLLLFCVNFHVFSTNWWNWLSKDLQICLLQTSNISRTPVGNKLVDHADAVKAAPTGRRCSNNIFILDPTTDFSGWYRSCMCSTGPFQYRWLKGYIYSSCYYHHQIGSILLSHCYHIVSVVVCLRCLLHHILSLIAHTFRENREFVYIIIVQFMMSAHSRTRFGLQNVLVCLYSTPSHYHNCANLSEDIEFIKCLADIICRVCEYD